MSYESRRLQQQLEVLAEQNQQLRVDLEAERQARINGQAEDLLAGQVKQPRQFLQLLQAQGDLIERNGELLVKTSQGLLPLADGVAELLGSSDYGHYRTSAKGVPDTVDPTPEIELKHLKNGVPSTEEMQRIMRSPQALNELYSELDSLMPQPTTANATPTSQWPTEQTSNVPSDSEITSALNNPQAFDQLLAKYA